MSVYDHLLPDEVIELQRPPFYLTNRRLLRLDDADGRLREAPRAGIVAVERIHATDHRIMVLGVLMVAGGAVLTLTWAPYTAWLAILVGIAALVLGARGKLVAHQVVAHRIPDTEQALWQFPVWGADNFVSRLRTIAAENQPRDDPW